jgi:hypothetical protein
VVIQPLDHSTNQVIVKTREDLTEHIGHSEPKIVSDQNLAILARQLALHANVSLFCQLLYRYHSCQKLLVSGVEVCCVVDVKWYKPYMNKTGLEYTGFPHASSA